MNSINVQKRDLSVKAKKMRHLGLVPGNVFGKSLPGSISIQMDKKSAQKLVRQNREGSKVSLNKDGQVFPTQFKEKTLNTLNNEILHVSFQVLTADEKVNSIIHILLVNDEKFGALLEKMTTKIPYASMPKDMIDTITIDVDKLKSGDILTVKDVPELMNDKIDLQINEDEIILRINERKHHGNMIPEE